jgi:CDP-6-deoxy-D-xylo-4-hexulose-3-dehydrase
MKKELSEILNDLNVYLKDNKPKYLYNQNFQIGKSSVLYSGPYWDETEIISAVNTLISGKWVVAGENVHKFESTFAKMFNVKYAQMVNSGSSANLVLIASLKKYFKWEDGDEIIVSPVGFPTTISTLVQNNLKPVFIDIEYETLNFDINKIEEKITNKTKGIFVSPVLGNPPNMDFLTELCKKYDIQLIGDSCDSLGSKWDGKDLSSYYVAWSSSFYPAHHISTGEGGICCTNNPELKKLFTSFSWWGRDCHCVGSANLLACGTCGNRFDKWLEDYNGIIDHKYLSLIHI